MDEIAADYTQMFLENTEAFRQFVSEGAEKRSIGRRLLDGLKRVLQKIREAFSSRKEQNAAAQDALGMDMAEAEQALKLWEQAYQEAKQAVKKAPASAAQGGVAISYSVKYWIPKLGQAEWNLLNREIDRQRDTAENFLDPETKWLYAREKGVSVFAVYGIGDGTVPTPLYAVGGEKADVAYAKTQAVLRGEEYATNKNGAALDRLLASVRNGQSGQADSVSDDGDRGAATGDVRVSGQEREIDSRANSGTGKEDIDSRLKFSVAGTEDILSSIARKNEETAVRFFGRTYSWKETGYLTRSGKKLDFSGRHEGGSGGYRSVDHRDIRDAIGESYGGDSYSGAMVQFMREGNIRIMPESDGINLSVRPTKAQELALDDFISRARGEVILDLDDLNGNTVSSTEYPRGTRASRIIADIHRYFDTGEMPQISTIAQFHYSVAGTEDILADNMARVQTENRVKERLNYLRSQIATTDKATADPRSVERIAGKLIRQWGADMETEDITQELQELYDRTLRKDDFDMWSAAVDIGRKIAETVTTVDGGDIFREYGELRRELRDMHIYVPENVQQDIADYFDTVRPYRNRLRLTTRESSGAVTVGQAFRDLQERYPEFFDEDKVTSPGDQLRRLLAVTDSIYERSTSRILDSREARVGRLRRISTAGAWGSRSWIPGSKSRGVERYALRMKPFESGPGRCSDLKRWVEYPNNGGGALRPAARGVLQEGVYGQAPRQPE